MTRPRLAPDGPGNEELSSKQELAAFALASGGTVAAAARYAAAGERTIKTWRTNPAFKKRVDEYRAELIGTALGKLADGMATAADTLGYLSRKAKSETVRLGASRAVIELGVKLRESVELEERIAALETDRDKGAKV